MIKLHATAKGLTVEEVIDAVDKIDALLNVNFDAMDVAATKTWKKDSVELLKANGNNFARINNSISTITDALAHFADSCARVLDEGEESAVEESPVAEETKEEEKEVKQEFDQEQLMLALIASGVDPEVAKVTAANVAKEKAAETKPEEKKAETIGNPKPWFKKAVDGLNLPRKHSLVTELMLQQIGATDADKAEIQKEIDRLTGDKGDDRFEVHMNAYIIPTKKWTVTESGKIAEFAYTTGDYVQKGVSGMTRGIGKATKWTGEKIAKGGEKMENNAEKVGKVAAAPFHATGKGIDKLSSKKDDKKKKDNKKK